MNKKRLSVYIGLVVAVVCLWWFFRKMPLGELWESLKQAEYWWLVPAMFFVFLSMVFRTFRWQRLLAPIKKIGFMDIFSAIMICFMANNILPARMGEFIRTVLVGKKQKISISATFATVVLERLFDMMAVMAIFLLLLFIHPFEERIKKAGILLTVVYLVGLVFLILARFYSKPVSRFIHGVVSRFSHGLAAKASAVVDSFFEGLNALNNWKQVILLVFYTAMVWICIVPTFYFICRTMNVVLEPYGYLLIIVFLAVAVMIPTPGYVGTFHLAFKEALAIFGYPPAVAGSCAIIGHASQWAFIAILGLLSLWRENLSFAQLREEELEAEEELQHFASEETPVESV